ncbi:unnamed protein product [Spirodela intermedia]|uniref:Uncharacterized protein n=1 Tax=Spirodela intermedia TaxID=51605 RepID=A0A7I8LBB0_SPIIN|nr:unnamed protein product [Spirodela intermedia]
MLRAVLRPGRPARAAPGTSPADVTRRRIAGWIREMRRRRWDPRRDEFFVPLPESPAFLDTATMPMVLTAVVTALFVKVLMMVDESKEQERLERKIQRAPGGQGTVRMLTREEWEEIQEVRPRTPFESHLARPNARIRTGDSMHLEDVKDWTIDVLSDAVTRAQECAKSR